jgi:glutamate synthase domain-containing protein 2
MKLFKCVALSLLAFFGLIEMANAAVATAVTDAITAAGTDAGTMGAAVLVVIVGIFAFKLLRKAL